MKCKWIVSMAAAVALTSAASAWCYPLDLYQETGINRLEAYYYAAQGPMRGRFLYPGAFLSGKDITLSLADVPGFHIPAPDPTFNREVLGLLDGDEASYGIAVLDITDPTKPLLAMHNPDKVQNPGSVGKLMVALGIFQELADLYPDDIEARRKVLHDTMITADEFIIADEHDVPFWKDGETKVTIRPIAQGDTGNLWTWLDWMCSASSNAGASVVQANLVLMKHFGRSYPVPPDVAANYFATTPKSELQKTFASAIQEPVTRNGLDINKLRQGSFFTRRGKEKVPGTYSYATARELLEYVVRMEQGKLVDRFSSLEIKRLIYLTDRRIRYASSPALNDDAVYFKSGSLYSCKAEAGFVCGKYKGNAKNYMNSVAMVESIGRTPQLRYITVILSNVLKKNSADAHQELATRIHELIEAHHPATASTSVPNAPGDPEPHLEETRDERGSEPASSEPASASQQEQETETQTQPAPGSRNRAWSPRSRGPERR